MTMNLFEITKMAIDMESTKTELEALSERIDVMFMIGGKFEMDEYLQLSDQITQKIAELDAMEKEPPADDTGKDESGEKEPGTDPEEPTV